MQISEQTRIEILLAEHTEIDLALYDLMGRKVKTIARENRPAGSYTFHLDGTQLDAGNYYLILETRMGQASQVISVIR